MKKSSLMILILAGAAVVSYVVLQRSGEATYAAPQEATSPAFESDNARSEPETAENNPASDNSVSSVEEEEEARRSNQVDEDASIGAFLTQDGDNNRLTTEQLSELPVNELRRAIANLDYDENKNTLAFETEYTLEQKLNDIPAAMIDIVRCSNSICGLMFSGENKTSITNILDQLLEDEKVSSISGGGFLRHLEENGSHYGMLVVVIKNDRPLSIN
jgi:hypothetical protein